MYKTKVTISGFDSTSFIFQSDNLANYEQTFIELRYMFNGLGYTGTTIKDPIGNQLASLVEERLPFLTQIKKGIISIWNTIVLKFSQPWFS